MNTFTSYILSLSLLTAAASLAQAQQSAVSVGARQHSEHSQFEEIPFQDNDLTYTLGYEYQEQAGYWQLLVGYTPEIGDETLEKSVITPQLNFVVQDNIWLGGVGILGSYIETEAESETESDWTDMYWQVMLGVEIPVPIFDLEVLAYYPFEDWGEFSEFDTDDVEFGAALKYPF